MTQVFLSYARADGAEAALRLRTELTRSGLGVWQDIENMMGGKAWKDQLKTAIREVDAVLVLMTPGAIASEHVTWEWEAAQMLDTPVIPLLISACDVPDDLAQMHYHTLDNEQNYTIGLMSLVRDLNQLGAGKAESASALPTPGSRNISIGGSANNSQIVIGDGNNVSQ
ncbi:MAG: toll/interleukin-1 receptor domain-containing protein [Cyanobacteria bacterium J06597_16]